MNGSTSFQEARERWGAESISRPLIIVRDTARLGGIYSTLFARFQGLALASVWFQQVRDRGGGVMGQDKEPHLEPRAETVSEYTDLLYLLPSLPRKLPCLSHLLGAPLRARGARRILEQHCGVE